MPSLETVPLQKQLVYNDLTLQSNILLMKLPFFSRIYETFCYLLFIQKCLIIFFLFSFHHLLFFVVFIIC